MKTVFKYIALVFTILFIWAGYVQWNDPDAAIWFIVYGVAALASFMYFLDKLNYFVASVLCVGFLVGAFVVWPEKFEGFDLGEGDMNNVERGREALGLLIISAVMLLYALRMRFYKKLEI